MATNNMKNDEKKSIIKEALTDYKEIKEAADVNAKKKLAEEFPEKFNELLKEELNKKNGEDDLIVKSEITESKEANKMKKEKITKKDEKKVVTENIDNVEVQPELDSVSDEIEVDNDNFEDNDDEITLDAIEAEIANMEDIEEGLFGGSIKDKIAALNPEDTEGIEKVFNSIGNFKNKMIQQGAVKMGVKRTPPAKKLEILKQYAEDGGTIKLDNDGTVRYQSKEEMGQKTGSQFAGGGTQGKMTHGGVVGENDEFMNEIFGMGIKSKIASLSPEDTDSIEKVFNSVGNFKNKMIQQGAVKKGAMKTPAAKKLEILKQYAEDGGTIKLDNDGTVRYESKEEMGQKTGSQFAGGGTQGKMAMGGVTGEGVEDIPFDEKKAKFVTDIKNQEDQPYDQLIKMREQLDEMINSLGGVQNENEDFESEDEFTDADLDAILENEAFEEVSDEEVSMDEAHGVTYAERRKMTGRNTPQPEGLSSMEKDQSPSAIKESKSKIDKLIQENKILTKKLNESKKSIKKSVELVEGYKNALGKYRTHLKEMAIFNTNLSHVNNLFVNEELALTQEDKVKIINEFKKIEKINESQEKYKSLLDEMKKSKKTISENIEDKVSTSIQPSSKQKLDEVVEKTAYENNDHIKKMKKLIEYVEHRGKK